MTSLLNSPGMQRFSELQPIAVNTLAARILRDPAFPYAQLGSGGPQACHDDLSFHLEFLRGVLECGLSQTMVEYLLWFKDVLTVRGLPTEHIVTTLDWMAEFYSGQMANDDGKTVAQTVLSVRDSYLASDPESNHPSPPLAPVPWPEADAFQAALLAGDRHESLAIVRRCMASGNSLIETELHVVQPALYRIGEKWQQNQVTVAQEHLATAVAQAVMTSALMMSQPVPPIGKKVLLACVEGNDHAVGLQMVADAFLLSGWEVKNLGANTLSQALVEQVIAWRPNLLGLSVSFPQQLHAVRSVMAELDSHLGQARPAVIVGGLAINRFKQLATAVGAAGTASDAQVATDMAMSLVRELDT